MKHKREARGGQAVQHTQPSCAILFELEYVAVKGRQIVYDVLRSLLADKNIDLTASLFARYGLCGPVGKFPSALQAALGAKTRLSDKWQEEIAEGIRLSFIEGPLEPDAGLVALLKAAAERGFSAGALSSFDQETAMKLNAKLGLTGMGVRLVSDSTGERYYPDTDAWRRLARAIPVPSGACVALASSSSAFRAALTSSMRCIAVPDKFTEFQDFSGADDVVKSPREIVPDDLLALLRRFRGVA